LQSGDQVEVLTSKKQQPEPEWLEIAVTAKAKDSIKKYFRKSRGVLGLIDKEKETKARIAKIRISGEDSFGVLMRIMNIICDHKANMRDLHVTSSEKMFHCDVELVVFKQKVVSQMCMKLRDIESVTAVNVIEIN
jgi:(p)ppGpp synthase/HD superfamily hydrolase